ncbi:UNVERIFIED_CONTAM: Retrovirus-related Pol polyprotein from transposon TNT 1-94 [Sesamum calycinum]|uniref:Retrovirus-related Pol polyprotein from transposon TNT 1-94 n=1 Tax=Sesamum calycinum TaxID=2727403 RepID=A0AAW2SF49_9LAMI
MTKKPFVGQTALTSGVLDLIHTDVCGPLNTPIRGGYSFFITFIDDHSHYGYVYLMRYKSEAFERVTLLRQQPSCSMAPSKTVSQTVYKIWHGKPASYKFVGYPKETMGYYFYYLSEQKVFVSRNVMFLKKNFLWIADMMRYYLSKTCEAPQQNNATLFELIVSTDSIPVLRRSTRVSKLPDRYRFLRLTSQLDNDQRTYGEVISDIDSDKWLEVMKSEMDSMGSNQVWTLVDPPKGVKLVGCK